MGEESEPRRYSRWEFLEVIKKGGIGLVGLGLGGSFLYRWLRPSAASEVPYKVYLPLIPKEGETPPSRKRGLYYGPYRDGQDPDWGPHPTEENFREDMPILAFVGNAIRTYGTENNLDKISKVAQESTDLKINVGAWIGRDWAVNERQITNLITIAQTYKNVDSVTVGSEVMLRGDLTENELVDYISRVKGEVYQPVTTGETWWEWLHHEQLAAEVDFLFVHFFPYWEGISLNQAVPFIKEKYQEIKLKYPQKTVVIGETGWPSAGEVKGGAVPSLENQKRFIEEFLAWTQEGDIDFYYFEAFDENWKKKYEGEVGGHWGIYNSDRTPKHPGLKFI